MPAPRKVTPENYQEIKRYILDHGQAAAIAKYGLGRATCSLINNLATYEDYSAETREKARAYYLKRKQELKERIKSNPFGDAAEPKPVAPAQDPVPKNLNGPVTTRLIEDVKTVMPMTLDQYRKAYENELGRTKELEDEVAALRQEVERLTEELSKEANSVIDNCPDVISSTKVEITVGKAHIIVTEDGTDVL